MQNEQIFSLVSWTATAGWLILILLPRWRSTQWVAGLAIPVLLSLSYFILLGMGFLGMGTAEPIDASYLNSDDVTPGFMELSGVMALFADDRSFLVAWIHFLAFDLFIGAWEVRDSQKHGIHHLIVVPCLLLTYIFGPVGLFLYMIARTIRTKVLPGRKIELPGSGSLNIS
ncbi:MAG: DUF4281 domain-containing protein [Rhodothermaceae bacterium]|nr:DUF4281 domain-containing protein [Rhodothermaceae bacterium]